MHSYLTFFVGLHPKLACHYYVVMENKLAKIMCSASLTIQCHVISKNRQKCQDTPVYFIKYFCAKPFHNFFRFFIFEWTKKIVCQTCSPPICYHKCSPILSQFTSFMQSSCCPRYVPSEMLKNVKQIPVLAKEIFNIFSVKLFLILHNDAGTNYFCLHPNAFRFHQSTCIIFFSLVA